jgi:hypothetical protein
MTTKTIDDLTAAAALAGTDKSVVAQGDAVLKRTTLAKIAALLAPTVLYPTANEPPASNYATFDIRNGHPVLDFDAATSEAAIFSSTLPLSYGGAGLAVEIGYSMTSATSGTCGWTVEFERIGDGQQDVDSDGFAAPQTVTAVTVPGTSGHVDVVSVNVSNGANIDSIAAGEQFRIRIKRDVANDDAAGDAELHFVRVREQ